MRTLKSTENICNALFLSLDITSIGVFMFLSKTKKVKPKQDEMVWQQGFLGVIQGIKK